MEKVLAEVKFINEQQIDMFGHFSIIYMKTYEAFHSKGKINNIFLTNFYIKDAFRFYLLITFTISRQLHNIYIYGDSIGIGIVVGK